MTLRLWPALAVALIAMVSLPAPPAAAQRITYCCHDERGMQICSDSLPAVCYGRAYREMSPQGTLIRKVDPPISAEERARRDAEAAKALEAQRARVEQERRNRALLATYSSEKDIDTVRDRKIGELERIIQKSQAKHDEALKRQAALKEEAEFFKNKDDIPQELKASLREVDTELRVNRNIIDDKKKEIAETRARYDEEKARWLKLSAPPPLADRPGLNGSRPAR